jgi:hypothetical protein
MTLGLMAAKTRSAPSNTLGIHASFTGFMRTLSTINWTSLIAVAIVSSLGLALAQNVTRTQIVLPVGDGKISSEAKTGFVFSCQQRFPGNPPGAFKAGAWLNSSTWEPSKKPVVDGAVAWPDSQVKFRLEGANRTISTWLLEFTVSIGFSVDSSLAPRWLEHSMITFGFAVTLECDLESDFV